MRKRGSNGNETRRQLRAAAIKLLFKHGYEKMNLRMLAKRIGIRVGSLYNYFESKEDFLFWLLTDSHERMRVKFEKIDETVVEPEEGVRRFISFHLGHLLAEPEEANILSMQAGHQLSRKNFRLYSNMQREYTDKLCAIVERGVALGKFRTPKPKLTAFAVLQMLNTVPRWYRAGGELTPDQMIAFYTGLILSMLNAPLAPAEDTNHSGRAISRSENADLENADSPRRRRRGNLPVGSLVASVKDWR